MKLFLAILFSINALLSALRLIWILPQMAENTTWVNAVDILVIILWWVSAVGNWVMFIKSKKESKNEDNGSN